MVPPKFPEDMINGLRERLMRGDGISVDTAKGKLFIANGPQFGLEPGLMISAERGGCGWFPANKVPGLTKFSLIKAGFTSFAADQVFALISALFSHREDTQRLLGFQPAEITYQLNA